MYFQAYTVTKSVNEEFAVTRIVDYISGGSVNISRLSFSFHGLERFFLSSLHYFAEFLLFFRGFSSHQRARHIRTIKLVHGTKIQNDQIAFTDYSVSAAAVRKRSAGT